ncbi:MAG TPA: response regulator [Candidatus Methylomirabilis sp.]|nr:response regulator [Candidatus Methylomirabilis sp.]
MAKDQYKYFRIEARELLEGLNQAVLELERGGSRKEVLGRLLRLAHTLKGASRVVKQPAIAECAHAIEDAFTPYRDGREAISQECTNQVLGLLDTIAGRVESLDMSPVELQRETSRPASDELFETVRVEIEEMDRLLEGVSEASVQLRALRNELETLDRARQLAGNLLDSVSLQLKVESNGNRWTGNGSKARSMAEDLRAYLERLGRTLSVGVDQVEAEFTQVRDATNRLRLLPASSVFSSLERAVRDAAQSLHKEVSFETVGGANRLDAHVLAALRDALLHVVRNAVAHGIEHSPERLAAKKSAQGRVELRVEQRGTRVAFLCQDDGRGIDVQAVRQVAVRKGLVAASDVAVLGLEEAVKIIMKGGVTTTGAVDEVSGRGIGLDVVRETATRLKGDVAVRSEAGKGTTLEICVPVSLSSLAALEVDAGGMVVALPLDSVRQTLRLADHEIAHSVEKDSIVYHRRVIPFLNLPRALRKKDADDQKRFWSVIVLEGSSGAAAIGVDRLLGTANVVVRALPPLAVADVSVSGAFLNAEGDPQLVLDPEGLVATACLARARLPEVSAAKRASVLVIDDSLTTRMLEQSILESAGYDVEVATSGEEGLEKARAKQYGLFLVDVEMPGMDGFEFVSRTQADARLSAVPSILVTSRSAAEDRRRGEQAGARAYIVKGEFDQGYLLRMTRELLA